MTCPFQRTVPPACLLVCLLITAADWPTRAQQPLEIDARNSYFYSQDGCTIALPKRSADGGMAAFTDTVSSICLRSVAGPAPGLDIIGRTYLLMPDGSSPIQKNSLFTPERLYGVETPPPKTATVRKLQDSYEFPAFVQFTEDPQGIGRVVGEVTYLSEEKDLDRMFNAEAKGSGKRGGLSASAMVSLKGHFHFGQSETYGVRRVSVPMFELYLEPQVLSTFDLVRSLGSSGASIPRCDPADGCNNKTEARTTCCLDAYRDFFNTFGTHVVTRVTLGGEALMTVKSTRMEQSDEKQLKAAITAAYKGLFSAKASIEASAEMKTSEKSNGCEFSAVGIGGFPSALVSLSSFDHDAFNAWAQSVAKAPAAIRYEYKPIWDLVANAEHSEWLYRAYQLAYESTEFVDAPAEEAEQPVTSAGNKRSVPPVQPVKVLYHAIGRPALMLSLPGRARQTSVFAPGQEAEAGRDNDLANAAQTRVGVGEFWELELEGIRAITRIIVWGHEGMCADRPCAARLYRARVDVLSGAEVTESVLLFAGKSDDAISKEPNVEIVFSQGVRGDRVRVTSTTHQMVRIAELQAVGSE